MAFVSEDEAEKIAGYQQKQANLGLTNIPRAPAPDPFANWQDTVDIAPPAVYGPFQPAYERPAAQPNYSLSGQGFDSFNVSNQMGPFEPYDLGFEQRGQQAPVLYQPWESEQSQGFAPYSPMEWGPGPEGEWDPRGTAFQASQRSTTNPGIDNFWASLQETGGVFADRAQRLPGVIEGLGGMLGFGGRAGGFPETEQLGEMYQEDVLPNVSGNEFIRKFTPFEPDNLPYGLDRVTDALAPINFATAAIAPSVPVLGALLKGPYAKNLAAEMGIDVAARFGAEQAAGERGASIPLFGDQPAWLRGLEGGLLGGLGAAGAIKGADAGIPALGRYMDEPIEVAPGQYVPRGEFGGGKFGPVEPEPPKLPGNDLPRVTEGGMVSGLRVGTDIPNTQSLSGLDYEPLGLREVRLDDLGAYTGPRYPPGRIQELADQIQQSGRIDPLIVMVSDEGMYVLEGQHRYQALRLLGKETAPALVNREVKEWPALVSEEFAKVSKLHPEQQHQMLVEARKIVDKEGAKELLDYDMGQFQSEWDSLGKIIQKHTDAPKSIAQPPKLAADAGPVMDARRTLLDALDKERVFRESGEAEALIRQGRATQAKGIAGSIGETRGGTFDEALEAASAGARVGPMLPTSQGLQLPDDMLSIITKELQDYALETGQKFDYLTAMKAVQKLDNGIHLQPGEIKQLGRVFGAEVEAAIRATNAGRIATVAELTPADMAKITRLAEVDGKKAARAEVEAVAQHKLADDLDKRVRMNPTNKSLQKAAADARARALKLEADSERYMLDRIDRLEAQAKAKTERAEVSANREEVRQAEMRDRRELKGQATQEYTESGAKALDKALATIDKADLPDSLKATGRQLIERVVEADGAFLDRMKGDAPNFLRTMYAGATGEVTDSWVSSLIEQRTVLTGVLQDAGYDRKTANAIAKAVSEMEVMRRWGPEPPPHIAKSLQQAKQSWADDSAIAGAANISQEWKNLMFGPLDVGIFGIQGLTGVQEGLVPIVAATVNRVLNIVRAGVDTNPSNLTKRLAYGLDGRVRGGSAYAGAVSPTAGARSTEASTLLRHIPGLKSFDQKVLSRAIGAMNDFQFRRVMGALGDYIHEGQLVMLKLTGSDITDPLVRQRSATWANAVTSAGKLAQRPGRAMTERAFTLSPSMVRAQSQVLGGMGRLIGPTTARETRILAATTLISYGVSVLAIGKFINDAIGTEEFQFDPSKPGFGQIRLPNGMITTPFPQTQLARLLLRSARVIGEEGKGDQDAEMVSRAWLNFGLGRLSPAAGMAAASAGVGFDPNSGWRYGNLNEGKSWWEQARDNLLPTPPMVDSLLREGFDPVGTPMETIGLSNFRESEWSAREREIKADPRFDGRGWNELDEKEKAIVNAEQGRVYSRDPEIRAQQERADVIAGDSKARQEQIDEWFLRGEKPDGTPYTVDNWNTDRAKNDSFAAGRYHDLYAGVNWEKDDLNPVDLYYKAIADAKDPLTTDVDWDKVEVFRASLSDEDRAYIERNTNLRDTVLEQQRRQDMKMLSESGYFDAENKVAVRKADPEIAVAVRRWGFSEMSVKAEDTVMKYTYQQEQDDKAYEAGQIDINEWNDRTNTRRDQLRGAKESIYEGVKDDGVSTEPLDRYFDQVKLAKGVNGQTDYQQVDAWVAQQPAEDQKIINAYVSPGLTAMVGEKNAAVKKIVESQYWDVNDRVTQYWAKANGFEWTEGTDADKFWGGIQQEVYQRVIAKGLAPLEAQTLTNVVMGQLQKDYVDVSGKVRGALRDSNPELARLLVQWGYWEPSKSDTGELIAAGTLR